MLQHDTRIDIDVQLHQWQLTNYVSGVARRRIDNVETRETKSTIDHHFRAPFRRSRQYCRLQRLVQFKW